MFLSSHRLEWEKTQKQVSPGSLTVQKQLSFVYAMANLYTIILKEPLLNALVFFYNTIAWNDLGLAIVFLTILIRLLLFPVFHKIVRNQLVMQRLQPELKKIQERHGKDKEKQAEAMFTLYKTHRINPFSSIFLLLIQLPVLWALFDIFNHIANLDLSALLYSFVARPAEIHASFLGLVNLAAPSIVLVGLMAVAQYAQARMSLPPPSPGREPTPAERVNRHMVFIGPFITVLVFAGLPAAVSLYWLVSTLLSIVQQHIISRQLSWMRGNQLSQTS